MVRKKKAKIPAGASKAAATRPSQFVLERDDFSRFASNGLGNPRSRMAHSCVMFGDHLYVGTTHPRGDGPDDRARILRHSFADDDWEQVYLAPMIDYRSSFHGCRSLPVRCQAFRRF